MPILYYLRHGVTDFNVAQRLQGQYDAALNERGCAEARNCGEVLQDLFARDGRQANELGYVSSPLKRARQTMEIVRATLGLDPSGYDVDDRLMEISYGAWEGLTLAEIERRDPELLARRAVDKWGFAPVGGECYRDVAARVGAWYAGVTRDTVVAAHGGVARALMANFHILPEEEATYADIAHGVVYVFADATMSRYA